MVDSQSINIPGYRIVRTLGKGGMASVYLAIQESFDREVALKVVSTTHADDEKFTERFLSEARIVSKLVHPNIVTVYDVGVHGNQHFLSMEYIPGLDLKQKRKWLSLSERLNVVKDVARALDYASKKGYVHRDVKPENIMLHDEDGRAVLMDFGIACLADTDSGMTQTGTAIGTPHYMSPEQAKGRAVDTRSDLYSLGVVLYLLLTGRVPYDADSAVAVGIKHITEAIPLLPKHFSKLQPIIEKVMAKEPANRYQQGAELIAAIEAISDSDISVMEELSTLNQSSTFKSVEEDMPTPISETLAAAKRSAEKLKQATHSPDKTTVASVALNTQMGQAAAKTQSVKSGKTSSAGNAKRSVAASKSASAKTVTQTTGKVVSAKNGKSTTQPVKTSGSVRAVTSPDLDDSWREAIGETETTSVSGEVIAIDDVDISEHQKKKSGIGILWPLSAILIVAGVLWSSVYFKDFLPRQLQDAVDAGVAKALEIKQELMLLTGIERNASVENGAEREETNLPRETSVPQPQQTSDQIANVATETVGEEVQEQSTNNTETVNLRETLDANLNMAPQLAQRYRDVLAENPGDRSAETGLTELRQFHFDQARAAMDTGELAKAQTFISSFEKTFPELLEDSDFIAVKDRFANAKQAQILIDAGRQQLAKNNLTSPAGNNALASFQEALAVDNESILAQQGIDSIVSRYVDLAQEAIDEQQWDSAMQFSNRGLQIDADNQQLSALAKEAKTEKDRARGIENMLLSARQKIEAGKLVSPKNDSAHYVYQQLLAIDNNNAAAQRGLREVEQRVAVQVERFINARELDQAKQLLTAGRSAFLGSERLLALQVSLEQAVEEEFIASQPRVDNVIVSNDSLTDVVGQQQGKITSGRTLHIGFQFKNFESETSLLQAVLFDGARTTQIAQVPVVVTGTEGAKIFSIDRPVEGFAEGGYHLDLVLSKKLLSSVAFKVDSALSP